MNIVYLIEWELEKEDGVLKKISAQIKAWEEKGNKVELIVLTNTKKCITLKNIKTRIIKKNKINLIHNQELLNTLKSISPNLIYFRYSAFKPYLLAVFSKYKTIIELNSNIDEELKLTKNSIKNFLKSTYIKYTNRILYKMSSGFISVTYEIEDSIKLYNKKALVLPNAIQLSNFKEKNKKDGNEIPNLVFMGTPNQIWHGIDKIVNLAEKTIDKLQFHIIGEEKPSGLDLPNISFYGYLEKNRYQEILCKSDIGIGTLSLHEKNMYEACPLKVREYLAYGLPIVIGYKDTAFDKTENIEWILEIENTKRNIDLNINEILKFCYENKSKIVKHKESEKYIDVKYIENSRLNFFKEFI